MAKKDKRKRNDAEVQAIPAVAGQEAEAGTAPKMKRKQYERQMRILHGELVAMQEWVKGAGANICVVFEGRDTAGKGGTIKRITAIRSRVNVARWDGPTVSRVAVTAIFLRSLADGGPYVWRSEDRMQGRFTPLAGRRRPRRPAGQDAARDTGELKPNSTAQPVKALSGKLALTQATPQ